MCRETTLSAEKLIEQGYRKTSNKYKIVSRVDRPDWVNVLAEKLQRAPADFYVPGASEPSGNWADYYRRSYSQDKLVVLSESQFRKIPTSSWDPIGYVELVHD